MQASPPPVHTAPAPTRLLEQQIVASTLPTWTQVGSVLIQAVSDLDRHGTVEGSRLTSMAAIDRLSE
jgi:hypothetical protein